MYLESEDSLGKTCSSSLNRLVRTRMLGGVGKVPGDGHPYPIYVLFSLSWKEENIRMNSKWGLKRKRLNGGKRFTYSTIVLSLR